MPSAWAQSDEEGVSLLNRGEYEKAREILASVGDTQASIEGYFETYLQTGQFAEGLERAERRRARSSDSPYVLYAHGRLLVATGRLAEAEEAYRNAIDIKGDYWRAGLELADLFFFYRASQIRTKSLQCTVQSLQAGIVHHSGRPGCGRTCRRQPGRIS